MYLHELISSLESVTDQDQIVPLGFGNPHSYRGYYNELAFEPLANVSVASMLASARSAVGATFQGWKGGEFTMTEGTECWLARIGTCGDDIGHILLAFMLTAGELGTPAKAKLAKLAGDSVPWGA